MLKKKRKILIFILIFMVSYLWSLTKEEKIKNFEKLCDFIKKEYPFFERKNINWDEIYKKYRGIIEHPIDDENYILVLRNMLAELDDGHAEIIRPPLQLNSIGILVEEKDNRIIVTTVAKGSPAEISGLKKGDEIVEVNGIPVLEYIDSLPLYLKRPRYRLKYSLFHGNTNIPVFLTFAESLNGTKKVQINRSALSSFFIKESDAKLIYHKYLDKDIGYIRINRFYKNYKNIIKDFDKALKELSISKGLIMDIRYNPGGSSEISDEIAGRFIEYPIKIGTIKYKMPRYTSRGFKNEFDYIIKPRGKTYKNPVAILIDSWCASACELFAISMKDSGRAILVGRKTAGIMGIPSSIKLSGGIIARFSRGEFLRLNGESVEGRGVLPDIQVDNEDMDIEKAIEVLKNILRIKNNKKGG